MIFPEFSKIDISTFAINLRKLLDNNLQTIDTLLKRTDAFTWDNLIVPLDNMEDVLERFWSPVSHLHSVMNSKLLRDCKEACLPLLSAYESAIGQNHALYLAIQSIDSSKLDDTQRKILDDMKRDFVLSGVALSAENKQRFETISARLSELSNQFETNILDAVHHYQLHIIDEARLAGLPEHAKHHAKALAEGKNLQGFILTLESPCYLAVITYCDDRLLREELYQAFVTRASDKGPLACQFDNTCVMEEILALRQEEARLLSFENYAQLSLATKMADSPADVLHFLTDLSHRARPQARREFEALQAFATEHLALSKLEPWDVAYASEKKLHADFTISQEMLRAFFPLPTVMQGLFDIVQTLYNVYFEEIDSVDVWHSDVRCYAIKDAHQNPCGFIYIDLFARPNKRDGAWMDSLQSRRRLSNGEIQLPIATLTCNFAKAMSNQPATLSHDEVVTLFHEFGHCLHHVLTRVDYLGASGIHGVEWDAVELPSQFFENWCWNETALQRLTSHLDTQTCLPPVLLNRLLAAKNFQSAMGMMRQLEFSLFDFRIHQEYDVTQPHCITTILNDVRQQTTVVPIASYNRFQHSFSHIFGGGYAAGYYSYKWAEVLSSDAFARFEEEGVFNQSTGRDFLHCILEVGGSQPASVSFANFRGRDATIDALLQHNGII